MPGTRLAPAWIRLALVSLLALCAGVASLAQEGIGTNAPTPPTRLTILEGTWHVISVSLTGPARADQAALSLSNPLTHLEFNPSTVTIEMGDTSAHAVSIRLDDNFDFELTRGPMAITEVGTSRSVVISLEVTGDANDVAGLSVGGGTNLGRVLVGEDATAISLPVRLDTIPGNFVLGTLQQVVVTASYMTVVVDSAATATVTVGVSPTALTFTDATWDTDQTFTLTTSTASSVRLSIDHQVTLTVVPGVSSSEYLGVEVTLSMVLRLGGVFAEEDMVSTEAALAVVDLGAAQFALDAIGGNFIGGGQTQLAPSLNIGGVSGALADPTDPWTQGDGWRDDFASLLDGGSFRMPLGGGAGLGALDIWGEGRLLDVSGDSDLADGSNYTYDGGARGFVLGFGLRGQGGRLGYGIAVARTSSHVDLSGDSLSVERIDNDLVTLLPYVGMSFGANSRAWLVGGVGEGEAELLMSDDVEKTDSTVRSLGLGLEHTVRRGEYDLSGRLLASGSRSTLDGTEEVPDLANVRGTAHRLRAEAEAERDMDLGGRGDGTVFGVAALRRDGGDAGGSFGLELGVGMRARLADAYTVELEGRHQVNSSSHEESSVRLRLGYDTQGDGRGLGVGLDESGAANVGYGWGRTVLGRHGVLSVGVGREGFGEVATTKLGFVSPGLRMSVAGDTDEYRADFDLVVLGR